MFRQDGSIVRDSDFQLASTSRLVALLHHYKDLRDIAADDLTHRYAQGCIAAIRSELRRRKTAREVAA